MKMQCFGPKNGYRFSAHAAAISNRFRGFSYPNLSFAATYRSSRFQRWDSTDFRFEISDRGNGGSKNNSKCKCKGKFKNPMRKYGAWGTRKNKCRSLIPFLARSRSGRQGGSG